MGGNSNFHIRLLNGFDDPAVDEIAWTRLLARGQSDTIFQTPWWQRAWWDVFGRGLLMLMGVYRETRLIGLAPMYADAGMVFFVGSGGSDYLDFIGEIPNHAAVLEHAMGITPGFLGFRFYHIDDASGTGRALQAASRRLGLVCHDEGELPAPMIDLGIAGAAASNKKSLVRHQRWFERGGELSISHAKSAQDIMPRLDVFFNQHIARWAVTSCPSLFHDSKQRDFYRTLACSVGPGSWLRFTEVSWNGRPIAFHFGFSYKGTFMWYKPSFEIELAKRSPGEVLLRSLLISALEEGEKVIDLGLGAEPFKHRFATHTRIVRTWGIYPPAIASDRSGSTRE